MSLCIEAWGWDPLRAGKSFSVILPPSCGAYSRLIPSSEHWDILRCLRVCPARLCPNVLHFDQSSALLNHRASFYYKTFHHGLVWCWPQSRLEFLFCLFLYLVKELCIFNEWLNFWPILAYQTYQRDYSTTLQLDGSIYQAMVIFSAFLFLEQLLQKCFAFPIMDPTQTARPSSLPLSFTLLKSVWFINDDQSMVLVA